MSEAELFRRLGVALAIGLLIGLERGWQTRQESDRQRTAGLRTFGLTGLLGGMSALVAAATSPLVLGAALIVYSSALLTFSFLEALDERNFSVTGVVAGILTFVLGAYATVGSELVAIAAAVAMTVLLALRDTLHTWIRAITWTEMRSALVLLAMSFLLLPVLPARPVDPWGVLNPSEIWLLAILIAAVSFAGYIAVRVLGERRGVLVAAVAGGLASSTATTLSFARLAREQPSGGRLLTIGVLLAGATMFARVLALVAALRPQSLGFVALPIGAGLAVLLGAAALLSFRRSKQQERPILQLRNPFELSTALWLAAVISAILLATKLLSDKFGRTGILLLAALSGVTDVDALTLSMLRLSGADVDQADAAAAILIGVGVNTASKALFAAVVGGGSFAALVSVVSFTAIAAMLVAYVIAPGGL